MIGAHCHLVERERKTDKAPDTSFVNIEDSMSRQVLSQRSFMPSLDQGECYRVVSGTAGNVAPQIGANHAF